MGISTILVDDYGPWVIGIDIHGAAEFIPAAVDVPSGKGIELVVSIPSVVVMWADCG